MKNNWKNTFLRALCVCVLVCGTVGVTAGCNNQNTPNSSVEETEKEFSLNYHIYELALYDSVQLKVKYYDGLTWSSDNADVVSVSEDGVVTANAYGSATITVTCGDKTDSCIFTVPDEGIVPTIKTNTADEGIALLKGDVFALSYGIVFNGAEYSDATFTFSSSDADVVSVNEDGKIKAEKLGEAVVTVTASWRNFDEVYLVKNIPVVVNPDLSIELTSETNVLATVTEEIDGEKYSNVCDIEYTVKIDGVDKTADTAVEWVSSDKSVATVENGVVTAHARGEAEITALCTVEGKTYASIPVQIQAVAPKKVISDTRFVYNVNEQTELKIEDLYGEVYNVKTAVQDYTEYCKIKSGTLTLAGKYLDTLRGNADFQIETPIYSYVFEAVFATHTVSNAEELKTLMDSYYCNYEEETNQEIAVKTKESTEGWYVVVTEDFSFNNSVSHGSYGSRFRGTFDGMGHTISNVTVSGNGGMFGGLHGTIKNLAVDGLTATRNNCFLLAGYLYNGIVDNVFVRGSFTVASNCGFVRLGGGSVSNCIVNITYPEGGAGAAYGEKNVEGVALEDGPENATVISNSYAIGNAAKFRPYDDETAVYATTEAFLSACAENITALNGFNEFWTGNSYGINFGQTPVITVTAVEKEKLIKTEDFSLNTASLLGDTVDYVLLDNKRVELSQNGEVQLKISELTKGETHTLQIRGNGKIVNQPFVIPTHQIGTREQFYALLDSYNNEKGNGSVNTAGWYVILTNDIDCENNTYGMAGASYWKGTFNGLGHTIRNIRLWGQGGLLGRPAAGGIIENTAFVDIRTTTSDTYLLTGYAQGGIVRNVYLQGEHCHVTDHGAMRNEDNGIVENVIVNVKFAEGSTAAAFSKKGNVVLNEAYAIGNATAYVVGDTTTPVYANAEAFLAAKGASVTAANGWNMEYWSFDEDGNLYFGDTKVE